ncbi:MAG: nucleotide-binding universal stress UspA family protein [Lentisphaeria bacterium]|jgi:nucleotide-binding universal stress UspA family protein
MNTENIASEQLVLACIDGSSVSEAVCDYSSWIALKVKAPLTLLHSIEHQHTPDIADYSGAIGLGSRDELLKELTELEQSRSRLLIEKGQLMLAAAKQRVKLDGVAAPEVCQRHGSLVESLIDLEQKTRVLVLGVRGESHQQQHEGIGRKLETVIRSLHKPILVVNKAFTEPKRIMLAYDGGAACKKALALMTASSMFKDTPCHIVHAGCEGEALLDEARGELEASGMACVTAQVDGKIEEALARYQIENDIDLMLMGAFSHSRIRDFLLGSFTAKMLAITSRPLLLLR